MPAGAIAGGLSTCAPGSTGLRPLWPRGWSSLPFVPGCPKPASSMPSGAKKTQEIYNDTVIGFNKFDREVVRITVEEPVFERAPQYANSI